MSPIRPIIDKEKNLIPKTHFLREYSHVFHNHCWNSPGWLCVLRNDTLVAKICTLFCEKMPLYRNSSPSPFYPSLIACEPERLLQNDSGFIFSSQAAFMMCNQPSKWHAALQEITTQIVYMQIALFISLIVMLTIANYIHTNSFENGTFNCSKIEASW